MYLLVLACREARGLWRRYLGLSILAGVSVALVCSGLLVTHGAERALKSDIAESVAQRSVVVDSDFRASAGAVLDTQKVKQLRGLAGVVSVEPTLQLPVSITVGGHPVLFSISSYRPSLPPPVLKSDHPVSKLGANEVLLPRTVEGVSLDALLGQEVEIEHDEFTGPGLSRPVRTKVRVVGLTDPAWQQDTSTPAYAAADTVTTWYDLASADGVEAEVEVEGYQEATVVVSRAGQVRSVLEAAQKMGLSATATQDLTPQLPDQLQIVKTLTQVVLVALVVLATLASSFLVRSLVLQRTREIGLLKSLGYLNRQVWLVMVIETILVSWVGALSGLVLATVGANIGKGLVPAAEMPNLFEGQVLFPHVDLVLGCLVVTTMVVFLGSALPLIRAFRLEPASALRDTL